MIAAILVLATIIGFAAASTVGVDFSQLTSQSSLECVKGYGYNFAIARVYMSTGSPDPNGPANINNAWNAGLEHVDGYIFPCYSCGNAAGQVSSFFLPFVGYSTVWLLIFFCILYLLTIPCTVRRWMQRLIIWPPMICTLRTVLLPKPWVVSTAHSAQL